MQQIKLTRYCLILVIGLYSCTNSEESLVIATAANSQFAIQEIAERFTRETDIRTNIIISSSGKHTAQIIAGAPYDVFISADMKYPRKLYQSGLTTEQPRTYAFGGIVLWAMDRLDLYPINDLANVEIDHIAMPNPETAPYGVAAKEALEIVGLWDDVQRNLVFGESVAQTNQYIFSGAAEIGFTAMAVVLAPSNSNKGAWLAIDESLYSPIAQGVVILKSSDKLSQAEKFYQYLFSEKSRGILEKYGYQVKE